MKQPIRHFLRILLRLLILWAIDAIAMLITIALLPGVTRDRRGSGCDRRRGRAAAGGDQSVSAPDHFAAGPAAGLLCHLRRGLYGQCHRLPIVARVLPDFHINGLLSAFIAGVVFSLINTIITGVISVDDEDSFYQGVVERLAARQTFKDKDLSHAAW